jgi:hypothetical protein
MTDNQHRAAKQRIFESALTLFARKGYAAVGVREIARNAKVNISMINYYYGEKAGILKTIINQCYDRYLKAITIVGDEDLPVEEHVRKMIHTVVRFFYENTELAIVAFGIMPIAVPEAMELKVKWVMGTREGMANLYKKLDVDTANTLQESIGPAAFIAAIHHHFQSKYVNEQYPQFKGYAAQLTDDFYDKYANALADVFLYGYLGRKQKSKEAKQ